MFKVSYFNGKGYEAAMPMPLDEAKVFANNVRFNAGVSQVAIKRLSEMEFIHADILDTIQVNAEIGEHTDYFRDGMDEDGEEIWRPIKFKVIRADNKDYQWSFFGNLEEVKAELAKVKKDFSRVLDWQRRTPYGSPAWSQEDEIGMMDDEERAFHGY